jgi:hypothetical protein
MLQMNTISEPQSFLSTQRKADLAIIPQSWVSAADVPTIEQMCEHIKRDVFFADEFFFPESNNWQNWQEGTFEPLYDFQGSITRTCENNTVVWIQAARGSAKSYTLARWLVSYSLRFPFQAAKIIAPSFRQSKTLYDYCAQIIKTNSQIDALIYKLEADIPEDNIKRGHEVIMTFINGSSIEALPAGDGSTLRGKRATVLVLDEFYLFPRELYVSHVVPFLNVQKGEQPAKLIHLTTSWYQDCFAYSVLMDIARYIKLGRPGYAILDITIDDVINSQRPVNPDEPEDTKKSFPAALAVILHQLETGRDKVTGILSDEMRMTYYNEWIKSSANWYRTDKIMESQSAEVPVLDKAPDKSSMVFVAGVDPAGMGSDATQIAVMSLPGNEVRNLHAVYKWEKQSPEEIAGHMHKIKNKYPSIDYFVLDKSGTLGYQVAEACTKKTQIIDGVSTECIPMYPWDHPDVLQGRAKVVLTRPSDETMISGLFGPRVDSTISSEIELKNAFHLDMKARFDNGTVRTAMSTADAEYYNEKSSKGEILDNIREALGQFPKIDRKKDREGKPITDSKGNYTFTRPVHDDGAYSVIYANWAANIAYKALAPKQKRTDAPMVWGSQAEEVPVETHHVVSARLY